MRYSPFLFLKRLVFIQFFFALLPFLLALVLSLFLGDIGQVYERLAVARTISFEFLLAILSTTIQLFVILLAFLSWYAPHYVADRERIVHNRGNLLSTKHLANTPAITTMRIKQGWLAERAGYGSIIIETSDASRQATIRDVNDPHWHMDLIWELVDPDSSATELLVGRSPGELVSAGEGQYVEFKASLMWDYRQQRVNKELYLPVMKNTAAFMNAAGGFVVIGVDDDGQVIGLQPDFDAMRRGSPDGFESIFSNAFNKMIGVEHRHFVDVVFSDFDGMVICIVRVRPSDRPIFLYYKGEESFYIRAGNASQPLSISQAARYIMRRFSSIEV